MSATPHASEALHSAFVQSGFSINIWRKTDVQHNGQANDHRLELHRAKEAGLITSERYATALPRSHTVNLTGLLGLWALTGF